jgi:hypothetical protein
MTNIRFLLDDDHFFVRKNQYLSSISWNVKKYKDFINEFPEGNIRKTALKYGEADFLSLHEPTDGTAKISW